MIALRESGACAALAGEMTPKFLATLDADGRPNCVPVISIVPYKDDVLVFGEFMMNKSRKNLLSNPCAGIAVLTAGQEFWSMKGEFLGFETSGSAVDFVNSSPMFRYNSYTGVRAAGLIRVREVSEMRRIGKGATALGFARAIAARTLLAMAGSGRPCMPRPVQEKFSRIAAVRAIAYRDGDGFPRVFPVLACFASGSARLVFAWDGIEMYRPALAAGSEVAVSIITTDPIAYQVKGQFTGGRAGVGHIELAECYSASPPLAGERLDSCAVAEPFRQT